MTPDPTPTPDPPQRYGSTSWPAGFRGIGGHLIRPPVREPAPNPATELLAHGSHLLAPILAGEGAPVALCPVCRAQSTLTGTGGWLNVRCESCGTEFVATDGSPPPATASPLPARSPIAPSEPLDPLELADRPRSFTSDVRTDAAGHRRVTCPQCRGAEVLIPRGATVAVVLRCPACHGPFLVGLGAVPVPTPAPPAEPGAHRARTFSHSPEFLPDFPGEQWFACPRCAKVYVLVADDDPDDDVITCPYCVQSFTVGFLRRRPAPAPAPRRSLLKALWAWLKRLFNRG